MVYQSGEVLWFSLGLSWLKIDQIEMLFFCLIPKILSYTHIFLIMFPVNIDWNLEVTEIFRLGCKFSYNIPSVHLHILHVPYTLGIRITSWVIWLIVCNTSLQCLLPLWNIKFKVESYWNLPSYYSFSKICYEKKFHRFS